MKRLTTGLLIALLAVLSGCASGPKFRDIHSSIAPSESETGRIYFYRPGKMFGAGIQPKVWLNGEVVGKSTPGGFFYVDQEPGNCTVSMTSEVEKELTFTIDRGQTRYVRLSVGLGVVVYRVYPELKDESEALPEIQSMSYIGTTEEK